MVIHKRVVWAGAVVAVWQFIGCTKISDSTYQVVSAIHNPVYQAGQRRVYQYSVIPGGVYSTEELSRARRTDPVVAEHYMDFGQNIRVTQLSQDQLVYVSYRKADKVYWTKKRHRVCKGENIVTDGKNVARSRCGNRLSNTPKLPVGKTEPAETALNSPEWRQGSPDVHTGAPADSNSLAGTGFGPENRTGSDQPARTGAANDSANPVQSGAYSPAGRTGAAKNIEFGLPTNYYPTYSPVFAIGPLVSRSVTPTGPTSGGTPSGGNTPIGITPEPESVLLVMLGGGAIVWARRRRASLR